jgi:hypothetical protein
MYVQAFAVQYLQGFVGFRDDGEGAASKGKGVQPARHPQRYELAQLVGLNRCREQLYIIRGAKVKLARGGWHTHRSRPCKVE